MRLGVLSDSHDHLEYLRRAIQTLKERRVDGWIHLGDYVAPFSAELLKPLEGRKWFLFGNNDGERPGLIRVLGDLMSGPLEIRLNNRSILLMHEPYLLEAARQSARYDLILYGHTHRVDYRREGGMVILNPGEVCGWVTGSPTCALVDLDPLRVEVLTVFGDPVALPV